MENQFNIMFEKTVITERSWIVCFMRLSLSLLLSSEALAVTNTLTVSSNHPHHLDLKQSLRTHPTLKQSPHTLLSLNKSLKSAVDSGSQGHLTLLTSCQSSVLPLQQ